jgi:hypothetical protein
LLLAEGFISAYLQYTSLLPEHYNANLQFFRPLLFYKTDNSDKTEDCKETEDWEKAVMSKKGNL